MAQSRLHKFANIFHRVEGFIKSGVIKPDDKPIWYDVCTRFPPSVLPDFLRPAPEVTVKPIFYHEDKIRAEFYQVFGSPGVIDLMDSEKKPICEQFIHQYIEAARSSPKDLDDVTLFKLAVKRLRDSGVKLRTLKGEESSDSRPKSKLNVTDLLDE